MASLLYLFFEAPFTRMEKVLLNKKIDDRSETLDKSRNKCNSVAQNRINNNLNDNQIYSTDVSHVMHITKM